MKKLQNTDLDNNDVLSDISDLDFAFQDNNTGDAKELFNETKVKARTDLSSKQISKVARAYYLFKICDLPEGEKLLDLFLTLRISKDRKSRAEFVDGLKAKLDNAIATNPLNKTFNK